MELAFISIFFCMLWNLCCLGFCYCGRPGAVQFPVPHGQRFIAIIFACFFTGAHSFTVLSVPGVLLGFGVF